MRLGTAQASTNFIVHQDVPFILIIWPPTIKALAAVLDFPAEMLHLSYEGKEAELQIILEYIQPRKFTWDTNSEYFTFAFDNEPEELANEDKGDEQLVSISADDLGLGPLQYKSAQDDFDLSFDVRKKLVNLWSEEAVESSRFIWQTDIIASPPQNFGSADVPVQHKFWGDWGPVHLPGCKKNGPRTWLNCPKRVG